MSSPPKINIKVPGAKGNAASTVVATGSPSPAQNKSNPKIQTIDAGKCTFLMLNVFSTTIKDSFINNSFSFKRRKRKRKRRSGNCKETHARENRNLKIASQKPKH